MSDEISFAAISRRDGSAGDGIHLVWTPPGGSGFAVGGFDIQRRLATDFRIDCHTLSSSELAALHSRFEINLGFGRIGVRRSGCPTGLGKSAGGLSHRVDLGALDEGRVANPVQAGGAAIRVLRGDGQPTDTATIVRDGLQLTAGTEIELPKGVTAVSLAFAGAGATLKVEARARDGQILDGVVLGLEEGVLAQVRLAAESIVSITITARGGEAVLVSVDFDQLGTSLSVAAAAAAEAHFVRADMPPPPIAAVSIFNPLCLCYDIDFVALQRFVRVTVRTKAALIIALRDGKTVASQLRAADGGMQLATFSEGTLDQVMIYVVGPISGLTVCADVNAEDEIAEWAGVPFIAKGIDFPLTTLDASLGGASGEQALAESRLLEGESFDPAHFSEVAGMLNETLSVAKDAAPVLMSLREREKAENPFVELAPWTYALSLTLDAAWRRILGCGHLDPASDLSPDETYDYRITGRFRRADVEETLYGFHTLPHGTRLPPAFHLGPVRFHAPGRPLVDFGSAAGDVILRRLGRKGVQLEAPPGGGPCMVISFDQPVQRVVLELDPDGSQSLSYEAKASEFLVGIGDAVFADTLPRRNRAEIEFPAPIDTLHLHGIGFLYGVRLIAGPPDADTEELITRSAVLYAIRFVDSAPPEPPMLVETENLQQPVTAGDQAASVLQGLPEMGFRLRWAPPEDSDISPLPMPWPDDIAAQPRSSAAGFHIERRAVETGAPFAGIEKVQTLFVGNRLGAADPGQIRQGGDLLALYGDATSAAPPADRLMEIDDVLVSAVGFRAEPGSTHQYRVFSIDAIGRRSAAARLGAETRLEKHRAPPQPVGPPQTATIAPAGVRARFVQAADKHLTAADGALLGDSDNAIVLDWSWTARERAQDPFAAEFRLYFLDTPPDVIAGQITTQPISAGGGFAAQAALSRAVDTDAMQGAYVDAGGYPFRVSAHGAGSSVELQLDAALLEPDLSPQPGSFELVASLDGSELRPGAGGERVAVIPITGQTEYQVILRDRIQLDAATPRSRVWVGVSAADAESYVADEVPAGETNGGRPGNESSIAARALSARYLGRPEFTPPPPLPTVPELLTSEPAGEVVSVSLDLDALLGDIPLPLNAQVRIERIAAGALLAQIRAAADDRIGVTFPDDDVADYVLANAQDQATFLAQIRSGNPALVAPRFLVDLLNRFTLAWQPLWQPIGAPVAAAGIAVDTLPAKAERYFHRIRVADRAGRISVDSAMLPQVVRVPSLRLPGPPELSVTDAGTTVLQLEARVRDAFDLARVLVFAESSPAPPAAATIANAELLRLPNRRDLAPGEGIRLRLGDGTLLSPVAIAEVSDGVAAPPDRLHSITLAVTPDRHVALWCVSQTRDGIPSLAAGPHLSRSGPAPLVVPALTVSHADGFDTASWDAPGEPAQIAIDRSLDNGTTWERVSPWMPETPGTRDIRAVEGPRLYRLVLRGLRGNAAEGPGVALAESG